MKTLELKHLAPYLPYKLKILYHGDKRVMNAGQGSSTHWIGIGITATLQRHGDNCKPILRSLSDLTKEIEVNGEKFMPIEKLVDGTKYYFKSKHGDVYHFGSNDSMLLWHLDCKNINNWEYKYASKLFEWHFDVFNLIPEGLAIDINTIQS